MSDEELMGRAADVTNRCGPASDGFRAARLLSEPNLHFEGWDLARSLERLRYSFEQGRAYDVGYWYGRITDPRRPWNAAARTP